MTNNTVVSPSKQTPLQRLDALAHHAFYEYGLGVIKRPDLIKSVTQYADLQQLHTPLSLIVSVCAFVIESGGAQ